MEIKSVKADKTQVTAGDNIKIKFEIWYETDHPYGYPYGYPVKTTKK